MLEQYDDLLELLPAELWYLVVDFVSLEDIFNVKLVNRTFHDIVLNSLLRRKTPQAIKLQARLFQFWINNACLFRMQANQQIIWDNLCQGHFSCESFGASLFLLTRYTAKSDYPSESLLSIPLIEQNDSHSYSKRYAQLFLIRTSMPFFNAKERLDAFRTIANDLDGEHSLALFDNQIDIMRALLQHPEINSVKIADLDIILANIYSDIFFITRCQKIGKLIWDKLDETSQENQYRLLQAKLAETKATHHSIVDYLKYLAKLTFLPDTTLHNLNCWIQISRTIEYFLKLISSIKNAETITFTLRSYREKFFAYFIKAHPIEMGRSFFVKMSPFINLIQMMHYQ